jgi:NADH:ubiquinone oxidoreductase subunit 5 (subunit L)/multisubunit Na+/H+ antiporter MnhA subunit
MITYQNDTLMFLLWILALGALAAALGRRGVRVVGPALAAWASAGVAVAAAVDLARVGSFRFFDVGGWAGARLAGDIVPSSMGSLVPLTLSPVTAPLLVVVTVAGAAAVTGLAARRATAALVAALLVELAVVAVVVVERPVHVVGAFAVASGLATLAPLVAGPSLVDGRAAVRAFALHRAGDAALLLGFGALAASLGPGVWAHAEALVEAVPAVEPWGRVDAGLFAGFAHRTLWFLAGGGVAAAAGSRLGLVFWPLQRDLTASARVPAPLSGVVHGLGLHGAAVVLLVRMHPVLALAPEAQDGLVFAATGTLVVGAVLALAARDLLRVDTLLLACSGAVVAVLAGTGDVTGVVLGGLLQVAVGVAWPWAAAVVVEATAERDPLAQGGLEPRIPRTHSARLLGTAALALPPFAGWVVVERALEATVLSTRMPAIVVAGVAVGAVVFGVAAWRLVHRVFNGPPVKKEGGQPPREPAFPGQAGLLLLAFSAPGLSLLAIPRGLLLLLPLEFTYQSPLQAFCAPGFHETAAVTALYAAQQAAPPVAPSRFALLALLGGFVPWTVSWLCFRATRGGRQPPLRGLVASRPVAWVAARLASWAGRDTGVVRTVGEGVEALSRLLASNLVPATLDVVLQRLPAFVAGAGAFVVRGTQTGALPHAIVLALVVAAWLAWHAVGR